MITDQPNTGDGDIRQGGGRNAPKPPAPAPSAPFQIYIDTGRASLVKAQPVRAPYSCGHRSAASRKQRILDHVEKAMSMGLSLEEAVVGLGVSAATVRRWCGERDEVSP